MATYILFESYIFRSKRHVKNMKNVLLVIHLKIYFFIITCLVCFIDVSKKMLQETGINYSMYKMFCAKKHYITL